MQVIEDFAELGLYH